MSGSQRSTRVQARVGRCARMRCANFKPSSSMPLGDRGEIWSAPVHSGACRVESLMLRPFHRLGFAFPLRTSLAVTLLVFDSLRAARASGGFNTFTRPACSWPGRVRDVFPAGRLPSCRSPPPRRAVCSACAHGTSSNLLSIVIVPQVAGPARPTSRHAATACTSLVLPSRLVPILTLDWEVFTS